MGLSTLRALIGKWCVTVVRDHSSSSKVVPIKSLYTISYWSSIATMWLSSIVSQIQLFAVLATPVSFEALARGVSLGLGYGRRSYCH